jgi:hypothetical protein
MEIINRIKQRYPNNLMPTFRAKLKWLLSGVSESVWVYGSCNGRIARKHKIKGNVQFILWYAGTQGHKEDFWHDFDKSWWELFEHSH